MSLMVSDLIKIDQDKISFLKGRDLRCYLNVRSDITHPSYSDQFGQYLLNTHLHDLYFTNTKPIVTGHFITINLPADAYFNLELLGNSCVIACIEGVDRLQVKILDSSRVEGSVLNMAGRGQSLELNAYNDGFFNASGKVFSATICANDHSIVDILRLQTHEVDSMAFGNGQITASSYHRFKGHATDKAGITVEKHGGSIRFVGMSDNCKIVE